MHANRLEALRASWRTQPLRIRGDSQARPLATMRSPLPGELHWWAIGTLLGRPDCSHAPNARPVLLAAGTIYWSCEYFVNGIEWCGRRFNLGATAVGSVLAAFGTALPESAVTFTAVVFGRTPAERDLGVGAAMGGPVLAHAQSTPGMVSQDVGPSILDIPTETVTRVPTSPLAGTAISREIVDISVPTGLPLRVLGYEGNTLVRQIDFSNIILRPSLLSF